MTIRDFPKDIQSYILQWCLKEEKCPLVNVCAELVTGNCAIVRFLNDLNEEADILTTMRMKLMDN